MRQNICGCNGWTYLIKNRDDIDYRDFKIIGTLGRKQFFLVAQLQNHPEWKALECTHNLSSGGKNAATFLDFIHNLWNSSLTPRYRNKELFRGKYMIFFFWIKVLIFHALIHWKTLFLFIRLHVSIGSNEYHFSLLPSTQQQENTMLPVYQWCGLSPCLQHLEGM